MSSESAMESDVSSTSSSGLTELFKQQHPLRYSWCLFFFKREQGKSWEDSMMPVGQVDTVEDFWSLFAAVTSPSQLQTGRDYYIFKEGIQPMWEDKANINGGRWLIMLAKGASNAAIDDVWRELLMAMLGEQFGDARLNEQVCGAVINLRAKGNKISLWTRSAVAADDNLAIGKILKERLNLADRICYEAHKELKSRLDSSRVNTVLEL